MVAYNGSLFKNTYNIHTV